MTSTNESRFQKIQALWVEAGEAEPKERHRLLGIVDEVEKRLADGDEAGADTILRLAHTRPVGDGWL